jgi:hypothetical protein
MANLLARSIVRGGEEMPDTEGKLSAADFVKIQEWWTKHWKVPVTCPVCKTSGWSTGTHVVQMPRWGNPQNYTAAPVYPYIQVICTTCSHTLLFSAVTMGITPPHPPPGA